MDYVSALKNERALLVARREGELEADPEKPTRTTSRRIAEVDAQLRLRGVEPPASADAADSAPLERAVPPRRGAKGD